ncbi:hypothetical protein [Sphingobacterium sp. 40-24]|uniref:hypothetical protein n=1 Tax=Sphingobacterium sp. 40-24 TaxID=1895843 RepID=UPI0009609921|nr:hypothetical protein [Sphingobacterium sp. 40-24]OJZ05789.1 MAG: hypothetical protein BGP15_01365 [Sphingobacterium sp. 40-24]
MPEETHEPFIVSSESPRKLFELDSSHRKTVIIKDLDFGQKARIYNLTCDVLIIENCTFNLYFRLDHCNILSLDIRNTKFENVLSFGRGSQIEQIYLNTVNVFISLNSYCRFTRFNCYGLNTKELKIFNREGGSGENLEEIYIYLQDNNIKSTNISVFDRDIEVEVKNNVLKNFLINETRKLAFIIRDNNGFDKVTFNDINTIQFDGLYESPIGKLELTGCGISQFTNYLERGDDDYFEDNIIGEIYLNSCTTIKKISLEIPRPLKLYVEECKFDKPFLISSVYKDIHITPTIVSIEDKNSGDILIELINVNLNFLGTNFSNITVKRSGINSLEFETFVNHGKINFIDSKTASPNFIKANSDTNYLTAKDSILDNINFHFFDLNTFSHIHFINTNILGMKLFHYPIRLANYSENLKILPCLDDERDFNINAKFAYNQFRLLAERNGDTDKSVEYRALELNYLRRTKSNEADRMLLLLNEVSNWHGRNWLLGVFFTLIAGMISFVGYQASLRIFAFCDLNWPADYIRYIATYPKLQLDGYAENANFLTDIARLIGIIFMGYGIFQTISAFRKYSKK